MGEPKVAGSAERLVAQTIALIAEKDGSSGVTLREITRRAGFAHTNVYNYFAGYEDLLWEAFRRVLDGYADHLEHDLDGVPGPAAYLRRLVTNLVSYPLENPGLYRFIGSDPLGPEFPADILETVTVMKRWLVDAFRACAPDVDAAVAEDACNIIQAYVDGETFNLINARVVPGEDVGGRVVDNAVRLFRLLTGVDVDAPDVPVRHPTPPWKKTAADQSSMPEPGEG